MLGNADKMTQSSLKKPTVPPVKAAIWCGSNVSMKNYKERGMRENVTQEEVEAHFLFLHLGRIVCEYTVFT